MKGGLHQGMHIGADLLRKKMFLYGFYPHLAYLS